MALLALQAAPANVDAGLTTVCAMPVDTRTFLRLLPAKNPIPLSQSQPVDLAPPPVNNPGRDRSRS